MSNTIDNSCRWCHGTGVIRGMSHQTWPCGNCDIWYVETNPQDAHVKLRAQGSDPGPGPHFWLIVDGGYWCEAGCDAVMNNGAQWVWYRDFTGIAEIQDDGLYLGDEKVGGPPIVAGSSENRL